MLQVHIFSHLYISIPNVCIYDIFNVYSYVFFFFSSFGCIIGHLNGVLIRSSIELSLHEYFNEKLEEKVGTDFICILILRYFLITHSVI